MKMVRIGNSGPHQPWFAKYCSSCVPEAKPAPQCVENHTVAAPTLTEVNILSFFTVSINQFFSSLIIMDGIRLLRMQNREIDNQLLFLSKQKYSAIKLRIDVVLPA